MEPNKTLPATAAPVVPAGSAVPAQNQPKFIITGDSIDDLCVELAALVIRNDTFTVKDNKSGNGNKYAVWHLDDGLNVGRPGMEGLGMDVERARKLGTEAGHPAILGVEILLRQLGPLAAVVGKRAEREVAVSTRETKLEQQLAALRARKAK